MAKEGARELSPLSFNKNICWIIYLLFIVHAGHSLDFDMPLNKVMNGIETTKNGIKLLRESESGIAIILTLLDKTNSVANKNQVKIFQQYLQEAVDETYRQKVERLAEIKVTTQQFHMSAVEKYSELQQLKRQYGNPLIQSLGETNEQIHEVLRSYIVLQNEVLTGKPEETEKKTGQYFRVFNTVKVSAEDS